jgi:hypothetical protein
VHGQYHRYTPSQDKEYAVSDERNKFVDSIIDNIGHDGETQQGLYVVYLIAPE